MRINYVNKYRSKKRKPKKKKMKAKKFIIMATARSGSTWLLDTLDGHPQIRGIYEPFHPGIWGRRYHRILNSYGAAKVFKGIKKILIPDNDRDTIVYGFKTIMAHLNDNANLSLCLSADLVVLLQRTTTASAVSFSKSWQIGRWHFFSRTSAEAHPYQMCNRNKLWRGGSDIHINKFRRRKLKVDVNWIRRSLTNRRNRLESFRERLRKENKTFIDLSYDELFNNKRKIVKNIYKRLGVDPGFKKYSAEIKSTTDYDWLINKDEINKKLGEEFGYLP